MPSACLVSACTTNKRKSTAGNQKFSIFSVPKDIKLRKKWEEAVPGASSLKTWQFVCEKHFEERCIKRNFIKYDCDGILLANVCISYCISVLFFSKK